MEDKMAGIAQISPSVEVKGGISTVLKQMVDSELSRKNRFFFISTHMDGTKTYKFMRLFLGVLQLLYTFSFHRIDIVHIHGSDIISSMRKYIFYRICRRISGAKIIYHFHGADFENQYNQAPLWVRNRVKSLFNGVDIVICLSQSWGKIIEMLFSPRRVAIVPNSVSLPPVNIHQERRANIQISFLGLVGHRKGVFDLLAVISRLIQRGFPIVLNIGGNGDLRRLQNEIEAYGLQSCVFYLGWINDSEKSRLLGNTDIYVLPSYAEGMPMSLLEAMSYGISVVTTNVGGIPEIVDDGYNGLLVRPGDVEQLEKKILYLILNPDERYRIGSNARRIIEERHNVNQSIRILGEIYSSLLVNV